jgi:hypothetical protein
MNGSKNHRSSDASDKPERGDTVLSLNTVQRMLPLVQRIVDDILNNQNALKRLEPEEEVLDHNKRALTWPQRQRRYQVKEDLNRSHHDLNGALVELRDLGVVLLDLEVGSIGFPTMVNNRRAYFSWHPGEMGLQFWTFADEETRRPIPQSWLKEISLSGKS